jgi:Spy/CpxP family protein refolding chaperone
MTFTRETARRIVTHGVAFGLGAILVAAGVSVIAQRPGPGRGPGPGFDMFGGPGFGGLELMRGLREVGLTDAQREQIRSILEQHRAEFQELATRGNEARRGVLDAIETEPVDEALIRERSNAAAVVMADAAILGARVRSEIFLILTPEQQEKAKQLRAERAERMRERMQRFRDRSVR